MAESDERESLNLTLSGIVETLCGEFKDGGGIVILRGEEDGEMFSRWGLHNLTTDDLRRIGLHLIELAVREEIRQEQEEAQ